MENKFNDADWTESKLNDGMDAAELAKVLKNNKEDVWRGMVIGFREIKKPDFLNAEELEKFSGFKYFDYDKRYLIKEFSKINTPEGVTIKFDLLGRTHEIVADLYVDGCSFSFTDTHEETYPGGRYINVNFEAEPGWIDLNLATNLLCAHSSRYNCGVPKNHFDIPIPVGEKYIKQDHAKVD